MRGFGLLSVCGLLFGSAAVCLAGDAAGTAKRPAITGLAYVRFYESDPAAAKHFYGEWLGLHETNLPGKDGAAGAASFAVGLKQRIEVAPLPQGAESRLAAVGFLTKDVSGMERYLKAHGLPVTRVDADEVDARDPEGNLIAFVGDRRAAAESAGVAGKTRATAMVATGKPGAPTSRRMIHAGWKVKSREAENTFYLELLGFRPYWHGGMDPAKTDWVSLQVPEGTDWIEYMLQGGDHPGQRELGVLDHVSLGTEHMPDVTAQLIANGMADPDQRKTQIGKDGKWQLNVFDPDLSRVEFMEFKPVETACCSAFTAKHPEPGEGQ